jgi:succinylglutamic semialdehyde dehydrogenase
VNALFFTGSVPTGRRVRALSEEANPHRLLALEMGGKNAALVLPDAPLDWTVREVIHGAFSTTGQRCSSTSRALVHRAVADRFLEALLEKTDSLSIGYFSEDSFMGPLIQSSARDRFLEAQRTARRLGYETLREGRPWLAPLRGYYVSPSVHAMRGFPFLDSRKKRPLSRAYWDEELFAPDIAVHILSSEEEMAAVNNRSAYGLAASVFTRSEKAFRRFVGNLQNGVIHWNRTTAMTPGRLPFGGIKASGNHRPAGLFVPYACTYPVGSVEVSV